MKLASPPKEDDEQDASATCGACEDNYKADEFWIFCDFCEVWFHGKCVKITPAKTEHIELYKCPSCNTKRARGFKLLIYQSIVMHRPLAKGVVAVVKSIAHSKFHINRPINHFRLPRSPFTTKSTSGGYGGEESATTSTRTLITINERSAASDFLSALTRHDNNNNLLTPHDFIPILTYCATLPDPLFVMETWRTMEDKGVGFNDKCYVLMMRALCRGGYLQEAFNFMNYLRESHGIFPILPVYNSFLRACSKMKSINYADQCLVLMDKGRVGKNEITYNEILKLAVWQQNLSVVHEIWKDYVKHYSLSMIVLRKFICSFTRLKDIQSAYQTLQYMIGLAISGKLSISMTPKGKLVSSRLDIPMPLNCELGSQISITSEKDTSPLHMEQSPLDLGNKQLDASKAGILSKHENKPAMKLLRWSFNDVMHGCAQTKNSGLAEQLMQQMQNLGLEPSSHTFDGFVRAAISERGPDYGIELLKMMKHRDLKPYDSTLAALAISFSQALELDLAEALLDEVSVCSHPRPYNTLLAACDVMNQPERAIRVLAKMKHLKLRPDIRTYELLFSLFGNVNAPYEEGNMFSQVDCAKRIYAVEMDMVKNNVQHSHLSMMNLLKALGAEGMIRELMQYLNAAESLFARKNTYLGTPIYNTVLHYLVEAKESHMAVEIFKSMKSCGVEADAATYNIMIDCCKVIGSFKSACGIVSMMLRDGFFPQTLTYTTLIRILLKFENFNEALNLLDQVSSDEVQQLDALLYNTIIEKACEKGRIDVVEFIVVKMREKEVQPNSTTCQLVFSAYVDRGFHTTAAEALQVLCLQIIKENDDVLQEKNIEFGEDFIFADNSEVESVIVELFRDSEDNLAVALLNLRWCATLGFPVSLSPEHSAWTKRLSANYNARPRGG
ncbi:hypothetical protein ACFE04_022160 [Oxalis oulophora]